METGNNSGYNQPYKPQKDILNELNYSNVLCGQNNLYINAPIQKYYLYNSFLQKKRETTDDKYHLATHVNQKESKETSKCFKCYSSSPGKFLTCQNCLRTYHIDCLTQEELDAIFNEDNYQCLECIEIMYHHLHQEILSNSKRMEPPQYYPSHNTNTLNIPVTHNNYNINSSSSHSLNPINIQLQKIANLNDKPLPIVNDIPSNVQENDTVNQNQDLNNLFLSVMHTNNITNEERLLILIKHDKNFQLHPYLISILKQRENIKKNFESNNNASDKTNNLNSFQNINDNNKLANNIFPNLPINNNSRTEFDFVLDNLCNKTQSSLNKTNSHFNPNVSNLTHMNSNNQPHNEMIIQNKMNNTPHVIEQKFPIDDVILFQNINRYNIPPDSLIRPDGKEIPIKYEILNKLIIVWDFLYTFHELLSGDEIVKYDITNSVEEFYDNLVSDINNELFRDILISFLYLAVKNLKIFESNLNDKEVFIVKSFLDNPNSSTYNIFIDCICEILRVLTSCISYSYLVSEETKLIIKEILRDNNSFKITIEQKIILLNSFVAISYETVIIKNKIRNEIEKASVFSIERDNLQDILKDCEKRKREITKNEKFSKLGEQIQELQNKLKEYDEMEDTTENKKTKADIKLKIAKYESILKENETLDERKQDILMKIQKTKEKITALKIPKKRMLGSDYKKCDYFCFRSNPEKVYRKDKYNKKWYILDNVNDIEVITNKLSEKGIREKKLKYYMKKILQEIQLIEETKKEKIKTETNNNNNDNIDETENQEIVNINKDVEMTNESKNENQEESMKTEEIISLTENKIIPAAITSLNQDDPKNIKHTINEILLEIERKFTDYLTQFNKEWESIENRDKWKQIILHTNKEQNFISTLRMFNHRFKNPYKSDIEQDEIEENEDEPYSIPEDLEKYVFIDENENEFVIYETDPMKILSPKVKIWPKDIEINEVDKYYSSVLLQNITNTQQLNFALHFYEEVILGLIKRRETKKYGHIGMTNNLLSVELGKK